ncbi:MAG: anti-anti-sigma factor [Pseudomonadales bacterium]|nr:anti-anti-sigma factor [Gammaproteobacteria bacterium]NNL56254.1 anti-anti-sigma factor [Pseudomonadales bacterium]
MQSGEVLAGCVEQIFYLRFTGDVRLPWCVSLEDYCNHVLQNKAVDSLLVDLSQSENLDSTTLGILAKIGIAAKSKLGSVPSIYLDDAGIERLLASMGFTAIFNVYRLPPPALPQLPVLPILDVVEDEMQDSVIDAHRALMQMNQRNSEQFESLVETLEQSRDQARNHKHDHKHDHKQGNETP